MYLCIRDCIQASFFCKFLQTGIVASSQINLCVKRSETPVAGLTNLIRTTCGHDSGLAMSIPIISLADMRHFYGELKDGVESQSKFREYLNRDQWEVEHFEQWMKEAIRDKLALEFQDLVVAFGKKLGFKVSFGSYGAHGTGYDGIWSDGQGLHIVIESKSATWPGLDVKDLGKYVMELAEKSPKDRVFGLYVFGDDSKMHAVADQIRGNYEFAQRMRVILFKDLIRLGRIRGVANLTVSQVSAFLVPLDAVNVGEFVRLVDTIILESRIAEETPKPTPQARKVPEGAIESVKRAQLKMEDGEVIVCPSKPDGVNFLLTYQSWGFIRVKRAPRYLALYVSRPFSEVQYLGEVDRIIDPKDPSSPVPNPDQFEEYQEGKKLVVLRKGSLRKFTDPVKLQEAFPPVGPRYTTLLKLLKAKDLEEVLEGS